MAHQNLVVELFDLLSVVVVVDQSLCSVSAKTRECIARLAMAATANNARQPEFHRVTEVTAVATTDIHFSIVAPGAVNVDDAGHGLRAANSSHVRGKAFSMSAPTALANCRISH